MGSLKAPTSANFVQKTLGATFLAGANVATLNNTTSIQNLPGVAIVDRIDSNNVETPTKREVFTFTGTSGVTTIGVVKNADGSGTDQDHAVGAIVEFGPDILWAQSMYDGLSQVVVPSTGLLDTTKVLPANASGASLTALNLIGANLISPNIQVGSDAQGDLYYRASGASLARLPKGNLNDVLQVNATLPAWRPGVVSSSVPQTLADATTMYLDFSLGNKFFATIVPTGNRFFAATNATVGSLGLLRVQYASTASLNLQILSTLASTSLVNWASDTLPVPTATVGRADLFGLHAINASLTWDAVTIAQSL